MTVHELARARSEQQHNPQEQLREVHEQHVLEVHHTQAQDHLRGLQLLDRVADLQDLEAGEVCAEEINPQ